MPTQCQYQLGASATVWTDLIEAVVDLLLLGVMTGLERPHPGLDEWTV